MKTCLAIFSLFFLMHDAGAGIIFEKTVVIVPCEVGQRTVKAELPFKVEGTEPISVSQIKTGCDCTAGEADAKEYAAGARGKINIVFTVGERTGLQRKTITVKTSDGGEQVAFFQTTVPAILEITPAFVFWRKDEAPVTKEIRIKAVLERPVKITGVTATPADLFPVEIISETPGKNYKLKITPKNTVLPATARIVLKTDFPEDDTERFVVVAAIK